MIEMIAFAEARALVLAAVKPGSPERVEVSSADGRILAEAAAALVDLPSARIATRDGYALRSEDAPGKGKLRVRGTAMAGSPYPLPLAAREAVRVSTGAVVPEGADTVVPDEEASCDQDQLRIAGAAGPGRFIREQGAELKTGQPLFLPGQALDPPALGLLVAAGYAELKVVRRPRAKILAVGDELRTPGRPLQPGQTYPSAAWTAAALLGRLGLEEVRVDQCADDEDEILEFLPEPLATDLIITLGGTGHGVRDLVIPALQRRGCRFQFRGVKMRPGHYTSFGHLESVPVLCLPGGPSAAEVGFYQFLRPALLKMAGARQLELPRVRARLAEAVDSPKGQYHLVRGRLEKKDQAEWFQPLREQSLHHELLLAHGYLAMAESVERLDAGREVEIELYRERW
jgi:molybdopterin molybdotransferase